MRKFLLISPVGDGARIPDWLSEPEARLFDTAFVYYGDTPDKWKAEADYYAQMKGFKYDLVSRAFAKEGPEWAKQYSHIAFWDDDIETDTRTINRLFSVCQNLDLVLAQPGLSADSVCFWKDLLKSVAGSMFHRTKTVEIMCPVLRGDFFGEMWSHFRGLNVGWGFDTIHWIKLMHDRGHVADGKVGVVDFATVGHTRALGSGEFYKNGAARTGQAEIRKWQLHHRADTKGFGNLERNPIYQNPMTALTDAKGNLMSIPIPTHPEFPKFIASPRVSTRWEVLELALSAAPKDILGNTKPVALEFGVEAGASLQYIRDRWEGRVVGFDSFEGLPEAWRPGFDKGAFSTGGNVPSIEGVEFVKGWFDQTVQAWMDANPDETVAFIHADADIYSSTKTFLDAIPASRLADGAVIVFDEFWGVSYPEWPDHEVRAFLEWVADNNLRYRYIGWNDCHEQVAVQVFPQPTDPIQPEPTRPRKGKK